MLLTIVSIAVVLGGLIFFHELGHFCVARALGMGVSTFSLGFGPKLLKKKIGKTEYALSLVPLGGYVALVGENPDDNSEVELPEGFTEEESFALRPAWQRLLVALAGPVANIVLAWVLCWILAAGWGTPVLLPEIGAIGENTPAAKAGLKSGDRILTINGQAIEDWDAMAAAIGASNGNPMDMEVERKIGDSVSLLHFTMTAERSTRKTIFGEDETAWLVGVRAAGTVSTKSESIFSALGTGFNQTIKMLDLTWQSIVKLFQRVVPLDQLGGPIMIGQMVSDQAHQGMAGLLMLTALISINLGILNLLPIPVLDGGLILFCIFETILRHPVNRKVQNYAMRIGLTMLICLMIFATFNDIWRIIKG